MRYRFYREHKYVCAAINDVERLIAKTDFSSSEQRAKVREAFDALMPMLNAHADYENSRLHRLLKERGSDIYKRVEEEHLAYEDMFAELENCLAKIFGSTSREDQIEQGCEFYLMFRKFAGINLLHLHEEESVILPELQKLYSDEELSQVEFESYRFMTPEDMIHMMQTLFPHMNIDDKMAFLTDIKACDKDKFTQAWLSIKNELDPCEQKYIATMLDL